MKVGNWVLGVRERPVEQWTAIGCVDTHSFLIIIVMKNPVVITLRTLLEVKRTRRMKLTRSKMHHQRQNGLKYSLWIIMRDIPFRVAKSSHP